MPEVEPAERFPVKFYLVAMAFIVLDVEIIFLYPVHHDPARRSARTALVVMGIFLLVLLVPFAYLLSTGAVDWGPVKQVTARVAGRVLHAAGTPGRDGLDPATRPVHEAERGRRPPDGHGERSRTTSSPDASRTS